MWTLKSGAKPLSYSLKDSILENHEELGALMTQLSTFSVAQVQALCEEIQPLFSSATSTGLFSYPKPNIFLSDIGRSESRYFKKLHK